MKTDAGIVPTSVLFIVHILFQMNLLQLFTNTFGSCYKLLVKLVGVKGCK